jgi:ribonuclease HII
MQDDMERSDHRSRCRHDSGTLPRVLIYAGIDEAGYGPMFGPLTVACTVFRLHEHDPATGAPNLWQLLKKSVCRSRNDKSRRIAIEDSKKLKGANDGACHPLKHLERGVLSFALTRDAAIGNDESLLAWLNVPRPQAGWYASTTPLPLAQTLDELRIATASITKSMARADVSCEHLQCEAIDAAAFNRQLGLTGSKASVNFSAVMRLVDRIWQRHRHDHPRIIVDRQGGRTQYLRPLQQCYPEASIRILAEEDTISRYELRDGDACLTISFAVEAESRHLPVALASMTAKYVRELLMLRLNRFFCGHMPELKPTAGYVQDGRRYLADIEPVIARLGLQRTDLVRLA